MTIDFSKCRIIRPDGQAARKMYKGLWEIFPSDRLVYEEILNKNKTLYSMTNYALFRDDEFIGNVGLLPVSIRYNGEIIELIGIAAVATLPRFRKQGVFKYLMNHCIDLVDKHLGDFVFSRETCQVMVTQNSGSIIQFSSMYGKVSPDP